MKYTDFVGNDKIRITAEILNKSWDIVSQNIKDGLANRGGYEYSTAKYLNKIIPDFQSFTTHVRFFIDNWNDNPVFTESYTSNNISKKRLAIGQDEDGGMLWLKGQPASNIMDILLIVSICPDISNFLFPKEVVVQKPITPEEKKEEPQQSVYNDDDYYYYGYD